MERREILIFKAKETPKENPSYKCLSLIMSYSVIRVNKKYYAQSLLEECKYKIEKTKIKSLINNDLDPSSPDESDSEFDNGSNNGADNDESND